MATATDGVLTVTTDPANAGVRLRADFSAYASQPVRVQFLRDGVPVRSGDWAWAQSGVAFAYDYEAKLSTTATWTAVPLFSSGASGAPTGGVTLTNDGMSSTVDCWVKPVGSGDKAIALRMHNDIVEEGWTARTQVTQVQSRLPVASWDKRVPAAISVTLRTTTKDEKDSLAAALDEGTVLLQFNPAFGMDDMYAIPGDSSVRYLTEMYLPARDVPVQFVPVDRPPTIDSPLFWPQRSYGKVGASAGTYAVLKSTYATYGTILTSGLATTPGAGVDVTNSTYGSGTYGAAVYGP